MIVQKLKLQHSEKKLSGMIRAELEIIVAFFIFYLKHKHIKKVKCHSFICSHFRHLQCTKSLQSSADFKPAVLQWVSFTSFYENKKKVSPTHFSREAGNLSKGRSPFKKTVKKGDIVH